METTAQMDEELLNNTKNNLNETGYSVTPESINPNDRTALEKIKKLPVVGNATHVVGSTLEEFTSGEGSLTRARVTSSRNLIDLAWERAKRIRLTKKAA